MGFISDSLNRIQPSATIAISNKAMTLKAEGRDVIGLAAGEPDFDTPQNIKDAATRALAAGMTKYVATPGTPEAREAVAAKLRRENGIDCEASHVAISRLHG